MRSIELTRDGARIVVQGARGLSIVGMGGDRSAIAIDAIHAFACVMDQIWVVAGSPATLTAFDLDGTVLDAIPVAEPGPAPHLVAAAGTRLATWHGTEVMAIARDRALVAAPVPGDVDFAIPLSATRVVVAARQRLSLREQDSTRWAISIAAFGRLGGGALVLDGKAIALAARTASTQTIVVIGLRDGAILHRITVGAEDRVQFAATRSVAMLHTRDGRLVLIDLRFGRVIVNYAEQRPIAEAAIDDGGRAIALRLADEPDSVVHVSVAELAAASAPAPTPDLGLEAPALEPPRAATTTDAVASASAAAPVNPFTAGDRGLTCPALTARAIIEPTTADETPALHERHRELAIAMATVAIARAWDEGRLAYPQAQGLPFASEVSGVSAGQCGLALDELAAAQLRLEQATAAALDARRAVAPRLGPLDALGTELGLTPLMRDLVLLIAAPSLWGELARLYGILSNDEGRPLVDEHLLGELLAGRVARSQIALELDDDAPLVRHGVIRVQAGTLRPFLPLLVDPAVLKLLRGAPVETDLEPLVHVVSATRSFEELRIPTAVKHQLADDLGHAAAPLRVVIRGRVGAGRHTLLAALAAASGRKLGVIDAELDRARRAHPDRRARDRPAARAPHGPVPLHRWPRADRQHRRRHP